MTADDLDSDDGREEARFSAVEAVQAAHAANVARRGRLARLEAWWDDKGILVVLALAGLTFVAYFIWFPAAVVLAVVTVALMVAGAHTF